MGLVASVYQEEADFLWQRGSDEAHFSEEVFF